MLYRQLQPSLVKLLEENPQRPVLLTGAKKTGKTILAGECGKKYAQFIQIDLETATDRKIFESGSLFEDVMNAVFFLKNKVRTDRKTLIYFREIQCCPKAIEWITEACRLSQPFSILAGSSFISTEIEEVVSSNLFAVLTVHPLNFHEFLKAIDPVALSAFEEAPVPFYAYEKLLNYFHVYSLIGGMPEIVNDFMANNEIKKLRTVYEMSLTSFEKNIRLYAASSKTAERSVEIFQNAFPYAATRIIFNHFGNFPDQSRTISRVFRTLEKHMLVRLVYPVISTSDLSRICLLKSPRLQMLDTGLVTYFSGIQKPLFQSHDMNAIFEGQVARQVVGQEISANIQPTTLNFWVRDKNQSTAEVDFIIPYNMMVIPVIVKSGEPGRLRALHQFIDEAPHPYAVRLSSEQLSVRQAKTLRGKNYFLMNLPYFLASRIPEHLQGFIRLTTG